MVLNMPEGTLLLFHVNCIYIGQGKPAHYLLLRLQTVQVYIKFMSLSWSYKSLFISSIHGLPKCDKGNIYNGHVTCRLPHFYRKFSGDFKY